MPFSPLLKYTLAWLAIFLALSALAWTSHYNGDEFHFLTQAKQVAAGEVITRDFFEFIMPGTFLLTGGLFAAIGPSLLAGRLLQAAAVAVLALVYWRLGRAIGLGRPLALLPLGLLLGVYYLRNPWFSHHWFGQVGVGLALLAAWWALGRSRHWPWAIIGLGVGATYAFNQMDGAALLAGLGLGALWVSWRQGWGWGVTFRRAGLFLAGAIAPLGAIGLYFLAHGALGDAIWTTHIWSLTHYRSAGNHNDVAYAMDLSWMLSPQRVWFNRPYWYAGLAVILTATLLPLLAAVGGAAWLAGLGRRRVPDERRTAFLGMLVLVAALALLAVTRGRADMMRVMFVSAPAALLVTAAIAGWERRLAAPELGGLRYLPRWGLALIVLAHGYQFAEGVRRDPGAWFSPTPPDARISGREAFKALAGEVGPADTIMAFNGVAQGTIFYFYLAPNATRFTSWVPGGDGYTTPEQLEEIRRSVQKTRPKLVLVPQIDRAKADAFVERHFAGYRYAREVPYPDDQPGRFVYVYKRS